MKKFHSIRTAVTIGMIITMMIQSIVVMAAAPVGGTLSQSECAETTTACESCECCEVQSRDQRCCCCSENGVASTDPQSDVGNQASATKEKPRALLLGVCLCGVMIPPMDRGDRCPERIVVRHVPISDATADEPVRARPRSEALQLATLREVGPVPRYSQRFLCMWLI